MMREEIIRMAREAGFDFYETMHVWTTPTEDVPYPEGVYTENLERFAALVAAAEREACAKVCDDIRYDGYVPPEDGAASYYYNDASIECAAAIRARGEK